MWSCEFAVSARENSWFGAAGDRGIAPDALIGG
jgi:hypothetical protein